ncbi:hypothetical protein G6F35_019008 [Rhizopus arrhizus]|nr:hypothetical protein G6F35_019008 [Rhizopus arrhizus]KAG1387815.1 hypothetical protein G6F58_013595 [Rhizopus delemar]
MIHRVRWLDEASHTVRLEVGWLEDGSRNGKIAKPTVRMMPAIAAPEAMKARPPRRARSSTALASSPARPSSGARIVAGIAL